MPEITPVCTHCGSDAVVPHVFVAAAGNTVPAFSVGLYTNPGARVMKGAVTSEGSYRACGDCGYVMMFASHPSILWDAHIERLSNDLDA